MTEERSIFVPVLISSLVIIISSLFTDNITVKTLVYFVVLAVFVIEANTRYEVDYWLGILFAGLVIFIMYLFGYINQLFNPLIGIIFVILLAALINGFEDNEGMELLLVTLSIVVLIFFNSLTVALGATLENAHNKISKLSNTDDVSQEITNEVTEKYDSSKESKTYVQKFIDELKKVMNPFSYSKDLYSIGNNNKKIKLFGFLKLNSIDIAPNPVLPGKKAVITLKIHSYENMYEDDEGNLKFSPYITGIYLDEKGQALGGKTSVNGKEYTTSSLNTQGLVLKNNDYNSVFKIKAPNCKDGTFEVKGFAIYKSNIKVSTENLKVVDEETYTDLVKNNKLKISPVRSTDTGKHPISLNISTTNNPVLKDETFTLILKVLNKDDGNAVIDLSTLTLLVPESFEVQDDCDFESYKTINNGEYNEPYILYRLKKDKINTEHSCLEKKNNKLAYVCDFKYTGNTKDLITKTIITSLNYIYIINDLASKQVKTDNFGSVKKCSAYPATIDYKKEKATIDNLFEGLYDDSGYIVKDLTKVILDNCNMTKSKINSIGSQYILSAKCSIKNTDSIQNIINKVAEICYKYEKDLITNSVKCAEIDLDSDCYSNSTEKELKTSLNLALNNINEKSIKELFPKFSNTGINITYSGDKKITTRYDYKLKVSYVTRCFNKYIAVELEKGSENKKCEINENKNTKK